MGTFDIRASRYSVSDENWSASVPLENSLGGAFSPVIAMDASENGIVAWEQEGIPGSFIFDILANHYLAANDTWGIAELLENRADHNFTPQIAIQAGGDAVEVWEHEAEPSPGTFIYGIKANVYSTSGGRWGTDAGVSTGDDGGNAEAPQAGIGAAGDVTVVWRQDDGAGVFNILAAR